MIQIQIVFFLCFLSGYLDVQLTQADTVKDLIEQLQQWPGSSIVCDSDRWPPDPLDLFFTNASSIVMLQSAGLLGFASSFLWLWFAGGGLVVLTAAPSFATACHSYSPLVADSWGKYQRAECAIWIHLGLY